jgi:hypothetical protein
MVSKAHPYGVSRLAKVPSRRVLEHAMGKPPKPSRPSGKRITSLEVHVMFEPSRFAQQCLQDAYAHLIPIVRRRLADTQYNLKPAQARAERKAR